MKIKNPTEKEISLNYKGDVYTIPGGETEDFETEVAKHWLQIYGFLTVGTADKPTKEKEDEKVAKKEVKKVTKK
jgi:hypothetical protein